MDKHCLSVGKFEEYFQLGDLLGKGTFGMVHQAKVLEKVRALRIDMPAVVAVKTMSVIPSSISQVILEVMALKQLDIPNVSKYYGCYIQRDAPTKIYVVMELIQGSTLQDLIKTKVVSPTDQRLIPMLWKIAAAIHNMHGHGVTHRDLKPQNIMVSVTEDAMEPTIIDFGTVCMDNQYGIGNTGTYCYRYAGSPSYMDPNVIKTLSEVNLTSWPSYNIMHMYMMSDWWSFAVMLHYLYTEKQILIMDRNANKDLIAALKVASYQLSSTSNLPEPIAEIIIGTLSHQYDIRKRLSGAEILEQLKLMLKLKLK